MLMLTIPGEVEMASGFGAAVVALVVFTLDASFKADDSCAWFWADELIYKRVYIARYDEEGSSEQKIVYAWLFLFRIQHIVYMMNHYFFMHSSGGRSFQLPAFIHSKFQSILYWIGFILQFMLSSNPQSFLFTIENRIPTFHKYLPRHDMCLFFWWSIYETCKNRASEASTLITPLSWHNGLPVIAIIYTSHLHPQPQYGPLRILLLYRFSFVRLNVSRFVPENQKCNPTNDGSELCVKWYVHLIHLIYSCTSLCTLVSKR